MPCMKVFPGSLDSYIQLPVKAQVRCVSQGVLRRDSSPHHACLLSSKCAPAVFLQPCGVRCVSSSGLGWYESVADSTPVQFTEQLLISSQHLTALPWWAGIICTTVALRTVITLPLAVYQAIIIAKVSSHLLTKHFFYRVQILSVWSFCPYLILYWYQVSLKICKTFCRDNFSLLRVLNSLFIFLLNER